jgi:hypothetical protein
MKMAGFGHGGWRPKSGRKLGSKNKATLTKALKKLGEARPDIDIPTIKESMSRGDAMPLEFVLQIMNNPTVPMPIRREMAALALPYTCTKPGSRKISSKEAAAERAKEAGNGFFSPSRPPLNVVK